MTSPGISASTDRNAFNERIAVVNPRKSDVNSLILDYLTMEGYSNAAAAFSREADMPLPQGTDTVENRHAIKHHILNGQIRNAIEALNDMDPELLDTDPHLHFSLLRLQLVELIRECTSHPNGDIRPALDFATSQISPRANTNTQFLEELEQTMALLVYPHDTLDPQLAELLQPTLRSEVASQVNEAVLRRQYNRQGAAICHLVRMRAWAESSAREQKIITSDALGLGFDDKDGGDDRSVEVMITS
jgi:hypothetical protein